MLEELTAYRDRLTEWLMIHAETASAKWNAIRVVRDHLTLIIAGRKSKYCLSAVDHAIAIFRN